MLKRVASFGVQNTRILSRNPQNVLYYKATFHQSTDATPTGLSKDNMAKLFGTDTGTLDTLQSAVQEEMLTRSDFGFYQRLLPIDAVQAIIHNINFLFDVPYWTVILAIPFAAKALITIPVHLYQQRKYESRLPTLPMAVYEQHCMTHKDTISRKRGTHNHDDMLTARKEINKKYGYYVTTTQLLPYTAAMIQIPIHLTMFVAVRTMSSQYPLWSSGGPVFDNALLQLSNLSVTDSSYILPVSIGCTMAVLQFVIMERNKVRGAGFNSKYLKGFSGSATLAIAYLATNWSIGFNMYILSNLASYIVQLTLMDSNLFRKAVGLNPYSTLKPYVRKVQVIYECHRIIFTEQSQMKQEYVKEGGDKASFYNRIPRFEAAAIDLLHDPSRFTQTTPTQKEVDGILNDIANISDIQSVYGDDNEANDDEEERSDVEEDDIVYDYTKREGKQYSFEFTSQEDVENRRQEIQKELKGSTTRSFLMSQQEESNKNKDEHIDEDTTKDEHEEEYHENVTIQDVNEETKKKYDE